MAILSRDPSHRVTLCILLLLSIRLAQAADIPSATDACLAGVAETTPSTEFVAIGDGGVVRHERTTLEWQRCTLGQTWNGKDNLCDGRPTPYPWDKTKKLVAGLQDGWRLPTGDELLSIVEKCHVGPAINPQVFPNTPGVFFWSSSTDIGGIGRAWSVSFFSGMPYRPGKTQNGRIRLVRGVMQTNDPNQAPAQNPPNP